MDIDKNINEKDKLYEWACIHQCDKFVNEIFTNIDSAEETYYLERNNSDSYVIEYDFQELPKVKCELEKIWKDENYMKEIIPVVLVGMFKNRIEIDDNSKLNNNRTEDDTEIPDYIYNF